MTDTTLKRKAEAAKQLAELVASLNPKCQEIGAGMMAQMQKLAKEFLGLNTP